jgi:hypothetical protein
VSLLGISGVRRAWRVWPSLGLRGERRGLALWLGRAAERRVRRETKDGLDVWDDTTLRDSSAFYGNRVGGETAGRHGCVAGFLGLAYLDFSIFL